MVVPETEVDVDEEETVEADEETGLLSGANGVGEDVEGGKSATGTGGVRLAR